MAALATTTTTSDIKVSKPSPKQDDQPMSLLHASSVTGDKATLQKLLKEQKGEDILNTEENLSWCYIEWLPELQDPKYSVDETDQFGRTPLMLTVLADHYDCAEVLLKHGANVDAKDHRRRTALHWAAYKGIYRFCGLLISRGAYWREKDLEELTALHLATKHTNTRCLTLILKELFVGEVDEQDVNKRTALHWSASYGNIEAVKILISEGSNIGIPDVDGKTPLHWAATAGDSPTATATVQVILDAEPSVINWQDYEGRTALHLAVADGNANTVETLINFQTNLEKCNVSVLDNMFRTPLHWAAVLGHTHMVNRLLEKKASFSSSDGNGATALHYAAQNNHAETVEAFLSHEDITDEPDLERRTALMWAAGKGADDVIKVMMQYGGDIDATDNTGATALHAAAMAGHANTILVLLEFGANVGMTDQNKHTPLFRAAEMGQTEALISLIEGGASVQVVDDEGRSPLHWAARGGHSCVCANLLKHKISPNVQDHHGRTPLQCAAYGGFINCMNILLEEGADPDLQDLEGVTALHYASSTGYMDAVRLLLEHGAFINHMEVNEDCFTPLDHALLNGHHEVTQFMIERGALSINTIRDLAASRIQACFRGYCVRKTFLERKLLLVKHEELRKTAAARKKEQNQAPVTESSTEGKAKLQDGNEMFQEVDILNTVEAVSVIKNGSELGESDDKCEEKDECSKFDERDSGEKVDTLEEDRKGHESEKDDVFVKFDDTGIDNSGAQSDSKDHTRTVLENSAFEGGGTVECRDETLQGSVAVTSSSEKSQGSEGCDDGSLEAGGEDVETDGLQGGDCQSRDMRENGDGEGTGQGNDDVSPSRREGSSKEVEKKLETESKNGDGETLRSNTVGVGILAGLDEDVKVDIKDNDSHVKKKPGQNLRGQGNVDNSKRNMRRKSGEPGKHSQNLVMTSKPQNSVVILETSEKKNHSVKGVRGGKSSNTLRLDGISVERDKQGSGVQHLKRSKVDSSRKSVLSKRSSVNGKNKTEVLNLKSDKKGDLDFIQTVKLGNGQDKSDERSKLPNINEKTGSERLVKGGRHQHKPSNLRLGSATVPSSRDRLSSWPTTFLKSEFDWRGQTINKKGTSAGNWDKPAAACGNEQENAQATSRPKRRQRARSAIVQPSHSTQGTKNLITSIDNQPSRRQKMNPRRIRAAEDGSH